MTPFTILTCNLSCFPLWPGTYKRLKLFTKPPLIRNADILNLQEVHSYEALWYLQKLLPDFRYVTYAAGIFGPKAGLATLAKKPMKIKNFHSFSFHKGILISRLENVIVVANTHLMANTDGDWSVGNRFRQAQQQQLHTLNDVLTEQTVILTGDFNVPKTSDVWMTFMQRGSWCDTAPNDYRPTFHKEFLPAGREPQRIDAIVIRGSMRVKNTKLLFERKIEGVYISNHMALLATCAF